MTFKDRRAARVLLIDDEGRALLLHGSDPARPGQSWWVTPGGGLDAEESHAEAAARELFEETGLRVEPAELREPIFQEVTEFSYNQQEYRQAQEFFIFRVPEWKVDTTGFDADEQLTIDKHRWWSAAEIDASDELIYPHGLADLLRQWGSGSAHSAEPFRSARPPSAEPARQAPSADPFSGEPSAEPFRGVPSAEPARSAPSADPFSGERSAEPLDGAPSAEPARSAPSAHPFHGAHPADPVHREPSAEPARSAPTDDPFRSAPDGGQ